MKIKKNKMNLIWWIPLLVINIGFTKAFNASLETVDGVTLPSYDFEFKKNTACGCVIKFQMNLTSVAMTVTHEANHVVCKISSDPYSCNALTTDTTSHTYLKASKCLETTTTTTTTSTTTSTTTDDATETTTPTTTPTTTISPTPTTTAIEPTTTTAIEPTTTTDDATETTTPTTTISPTPTTTAIETTTTTISPTTTAPYLAHKYYLSKLLYAAVDNIDDACPEGELGVIPSADDLDQVKKSFKEGYRVYITETKVPREDYNGDPFGTNVDIEGGLQDDEIGCAKIKSDFSKLKKEECSKNDFQPYLPVICKNDSRNDIFPSSKLVTHQADLVSICREEDGTPYTPTKSYLEDMKENKKSILLAVNYDKSSKTGTWKQDNTALYDHKSSIDASKPACTAIAEDFMEIEAKKCEDYQHRYHVLCQHLV